LSQKEENLQRSETKELNGQVESISSLSTMMSSVPQDGWNQSLVHLEGETWQEFLDLLSYLANTEETVICSVSEESTSCITYCFSMGREYYQVTLPKVEHGLQEPVEESATMKEALSFWKHVILRIAEMFSRWSGALMRHIEG